MTPKKLIQTHVFALIGHCLLASPASAQDYKGAACIIFVNDEIVLVKDTLNNRLSFPGGYLHSDESPEQAAQRETYEETGLKVTVGPQISNANQSAQYLCRSDAPIPILSRQGFESRPIVYALSASDYAKEIRQVYLIPPRSVKASELRFPHQIDALPDLKRYPEWQSRPSLLQEQDLPISKPHKVELETVAQLQQKLAPQADPLFRLLNALGENSLFFVLVPVIWAYAGWNIGLRCIVLLIISAELSNVMKALFAQPRPFHLMPQLQRMEAYGFGMPSGHALVATAFWGYCWHSFKHLLPAHYRRPGLGVLIALLIGSALARVYWGVHFFSDVIVGAGLGLLLLCLFIRLQRPGRRYQILSARKLPWVIGFVLISAATIFTPGSLSIQLGGLTLGLFLGLCVNKTQALHEQAANTCQSKCLLAGLGIIGIVLLDRAAKTIVSQQADSINAMLVYFAFYLLIGLWLMLGMYVLMDGISRIKSIQ
jgi:membrane-associated phospholipid phosphatase